MMNINNKTQLNNDNYEESSSDIDESNADFLTKNLLNNQNDVYTLNQALDYTCVRLNAGDGNRENIAHCGQCDTCQIKQKLSNCKQWLTRASHLTIKNFILNLIKSIKNINIYNYLNNLLKISIDAKDYIYSRNKLIPTMQDDHLLPTNNRCLNTTFVNDSISGCLNWFKTSSSFIKLNFTISLLKECDQSIIYMAVLQIKTIIEAPRNLSAYMSESSCSANKQQPQLTGILSQQNCESKNHSRSTKLTIHSDVTIINDNGISSYRSMNGKPISRITGTDYSDCDDDDIINDNEFTDEESFNAEFELSTLYANSRVLRRAKHVDLIRQLPVHLSKKILNSLNRKALKQCLLVSKYWYNLVKEVFKDGNLNQVLMDDMMLLRGTTSKTCNPRYANDIDVRVPNIKQGTFQVVLNENEKQREQKTKGDYNWSNAYSGVSTRYVIMEERNVFCGSYNVLLLKEKRDSHRVVHLNGKNVVAMGSFDKKVRFIDLKSAEELPMSIQGHAGSIKCIHVCENRKIVFTGSYDTSIRCWSLINGKCVKIFQGHQNTVSCISYCEDTDRLISGSYDKTCRIWSLKTKVNLRTFKHKYSITSVAINNEDMCISGGAKGKVKVFQISTETLIKVINAHTGIVTAIRFDKWHIITCSTDGYALAFSAQGNHKKCLMGMRHPKAVLCLEFQYLRAITGCADGKVRIWNIINGDCLRVMRGNSQCDPVLSMSISYNRMLINTEFNVILMEFEHIKYDYDSKRELDPVKSNNISANSSNNSRSTSPKRPYSVIRATRMEVVGTPNVKIFNDDRKSILAHSSGPISEKSLNEAKQIQKPRNTLSNSKLSIITINTPMTFNTATPSSNYNKSSLSYVNVQSEINLTNFKQQFEQSANNGIKLEMKEIDQDDVNLARYKKLTLDETKSLLRNQLKEMRKSALSSITAINHNETCVTKSKPNETKSCFEANELRKHDQDDEDLEDKLNLRRRPTSSPCYYDTKTKIKVHSNEFINFMNLNKNRTEQTNNVNISSLSDHKTSTISGLESKAETPLPTETNERPKSRQINVKSAVTKVFESHEVDLKTDNAMYPPRVQSKIPHPKIITAKRPVSAYDLTSKLTKKEAFVDESKNSFISKDKKPPLPYQQTSQFQAQSSQVAIRAKTATERLPPPPLLQLQQHQQQHQQQHKQKHVKIKSNQVVENFETNKIISNDDLKLMTYKEVDEIMHRINVIFDIDKNDKRKENERVNKKLWLLKSTGVYHGSLLAKQKTYAPEIRE